MHERLGGDDLPEPHLPPAGVVLRQEPERAVDCLLVAADQAARGWAKGHAVTLYSTALRLLPEDDPRRREVRLRQVVTAEALMHLVQGDVERPGEEG